MAGISGAIIRLEARTSIGSRCPLLEVICQTLWVGEARRCPPNDTGPICNSGRAIRPKDRGVTQYQWCHIALLSKPSGYKVKPILQERSELRSLAGITHCWRKGATGSTGDGSNRFFRMASDAETTSQEGRRASLSWWIDAFHSEDLQPLSRPNLTDSATFRTIMAKISNRRLWGLISIHTRRLASAIVWFWDAHAVKCKPANNSETRRDLLKTPHPSCCGVFRSVESYGTRTDPRTINGLDIALKMTVLNRCCFVLCSTAKSS